MCGRAAAAASLLTVTRTSSEPARASAATCWMVPAISAVSVLVMDWTAMGAPLPMRTPPTMAVWVFLRWNMAMELLVYHWECGFGAVQKAVQKAVRRVVQEAAVQEPRNES